LKICNFCKEEKSLSEFSKNITRKDGLNIFCRLCYSNYQKEWYQKNKAKHKQAVQIRKKQIAQKHINWIWELKLRAVCMDCGYNNPNAFQFDHVTGNKRDSISRLLRGGYSDAIIQEELDKCEIVCANCHIIRTAKRGGWYREF
jgi:hypothetical protein